MAGNDFTTYGKNENGFFPALTLPKPMNTLPAEITRAPANWVVFVEADEYCWLAPQRNDAATALRQCESKAVRAVMRDANEPNDGRPPMALAMQWVSRVTTVSLEMALPAGLGYLADERWGTDPWLVILGAVLGFAVGMWHLLQMASEK